jgi:hypothetical protein
MVTWTDVVSTIATVLAMIFTGLLVAAAIVAALYAKRAYEAALQQIDIAAKQHEDSQRPVLVPDGDNHLERTEDGQRIGFAIPEQRIKIRNIGLGPAFNVIGVLNGCESYNGVPEDKSAPWLNLPEVPLAAGDTSKTYCVHIHTPIPVGNRWNLKAPPTQVMSHGLRSST